MKLTRLIEDSKNIGVTRVKGSSRAEQAGEVSTCGGKRATGPHQRGQSLVELLVTIGLAAILIPALATAFVASRNGRPQQEQRLQAVAYLKQAEEAVRVVRDNNWSTFAVDGTYHPVASNTTWSLATGTDTPATGLTRQIVIADTYRDTSGNIATTGTVDPSTKKVTITVSWTTPLSSSVVATMYLTRFANASYTETTQAQFNAGVTKTGLAITNNSGGEVTLGAGNGAGDDWCAPGNSVLTSADLPGNGVAIAISATSSSTLDYVYSTTGDNASGDSVDVSTVNHNPVPTIVSNPPLASNNEAKAYGIYVDHVGGYVYFNENRPPNHTVRIANYNTLTDVGYYDSSGSGTGTSVFVYGTIGFTTVGTTLYTFDVGTIKGSSSQTELGKVTLAATGNKVTVAKDPTTGILYAYVVEASSTKQLEIIQVSSDGKTMSVVANAQIANAAQGQDVYVNVAGTRAYLVTSQYTSGQNQFFIINTSNKSGTLPSPLGSFSTYSATLSAGMNPKGVTVVSGNRAIVVGNGGQQYQVYNIANESSIKYCGGLTLSGANINAISSIYRTDQTAYSYIFTSDATHELQVIQGGNGTAFTFGGTFESQTFTATNEAMFNSFSTTTSVPASTTLQFKVAIKHGISGSCTGVTFADSDFVGTDGTSGTYFPATGGILPASTAASGYANPGQCLRYRAYFGTSDITASPVLYDITFNYSP